VLFWSNRLSVVLMARQFGQQAFLLKRFGRIGDGNLIENPELSFENKHGILTRAAASRCITRAEAAVRCFFQNHQPDQLWVWNGCNLVRQTMVAEAVRMGIGRLFFEVGNFPGKLFVDKEGVNCRSWYFKHRHELRKSYVDMGGFKVWKEAFLATKRQQHLVPQARFADTFNLKFIYDLIGFWFLGAITSDPPRPVWRTIDFMQKMLHQVPLDVFQPEREPGYFFFPLQVSTDSQVLWNSDISQADALRKATEMARKEGRLLVVKPHPAEPHWAATRKILHLKKQLGFKLVGGNTFILLEHCSRAITLNSTVGLEAILLGKPVLTLGHAHYSGFDELDLIIYIEKYLLNIDFFSEEPISESQLDAVLTRGNI